MVTLRNAIYGVQRKLGTTMQELVSGACVTVCWTTMREMVLSRYD